MSKRSGLLLGIGIAGFTFTTLMAMQCSIKSKDIIDEAEYNDGPLPKSEKFKLIWKEWIPIVACYGISVASVCLSHRDLRKRELAALAAYNVAQTGYDAYKSKVIETFGDEVHKKLNTSIAQDKINETYTDEFAGSSYYIFETGLGNELCCDLMTGRYFKASKAAIKDAETETDRLIMQNTWASINDFYDNLNLPGIKIGEDLGWNIGDNFDGKMMVSYSSILAPDGTPCLAFDYGLELDDNFYTSYSSKSISKCKLM